MAAETRAGEAIREAIGREGPITFRRFMDMALYTAPGAYYSSGTSQIGPGGDYFTSPEIHPAFGALVARQLEQIWVALGRPEVFSLIEVGAGSGALARDILSHVARWSPHFFKTLEYVILERNPEFARRQQQTLAEIGPAGERVAWRSSPPPKERSTGIIRGCFLSNELLDAFPVHRVRVEAGSLRELYVAAGADGFVEVTGELSNPSLKSYFDRLGFLPPEGARAEVNLDALKWVREVAAALKQGAVITIDYGYPARELYSDRHMEGSLLCFYRHTLTDNPYVRVGLQDMTSHVDFTSVTLEGEQAGLTAVGLATQQQFLSSLGMDAFAAQLPALGLRRSDYDANRLALRELMAPDGLGRVRVLIQQKGLDVFDPAGLRPEGIAPADLGRDVLAEGPPLLTRSHMRLDSPPNLDLFMDTQGMWDEMLRDEDE